MNMKRKTIILAVVAAAAMAITLVGCGVKITNIAVPDAITVEKGEAGGLAGPFRAHGAAAGTPWDSGTR